MHVADGIDYLPGREGSRPRRRRKTKQTTHHVKRLPPRARGRNSLHPRHTTLELGNAALVLGRCAAWPTRLSLRALGPTICATAQLVGVGAVVGVVARVVVAIVAVLIERVLGEVHLVDNDAD